jgi:hypothetical protein
MTTIEKSTNPPLATAPGTILDPSTTFVVCVESGPLELQTVWLVESLRRWGGRFADCPVLAITPRRGPALAKSTLEAFEKAGVTWKRVTPAHDVDWYGPINKPTALAAAEELTDSLQIAWLDSDTLVVGEPSELQLSRNEDFAAMPCSTRHDIGSTGADEHEPFWGALCRTAGLPLEDLPWIPCQANEEGSMRMYWQAGAFVYRRGTRLGASQLETSLRLISGRVASRFSGVYFHEQTALGIAVAKRSLRWRSLAGNHNFAVNKIRATDIDPAGFADARIVHYFGSLWDDFCPNFVELAAIHRPDVAEFVRERGPLRDRRPALARARAKIVRHQRSRRYRKFSTTCTTF